MNAQKMSNPAFFVFFKHEWCNEKLTIPTSFFGCIEKLPELVVLRDRDNNMWRVKVEIVDDDICFQAGWTTFTNDALLQDGDLLLFEYSLAGLFNVRILDISSCEKKGAENLIFKDVEWNNETQEGNEHEEGVEGDEETGEEDGNEDGTDDDDAIGKNSSRCKRILDIYGGELFRLGLAVKPNNPYFISKPTSREGELYIPLEILQNRNVDFEHVTCLRDTNGGEWRIKYKRWKDGRTMYSGGWRSFCRTNLLCQDDVCICEFVQGSQDLYIKVTVVRADQFQGLIARI